MAERAVDRRRPYLHLCWADPDSTATGYLVIDRLVTGIATGGTRMRTGCDLAEVTDLAREMSLKAGIFGLPVGGAKGGIDYPADADDADQVRLRFVQAVRPYLERHWVTAGDLGTPQPVIDAVFERAGLGPSSLHAALNQAPDPDAARQRVTKAVAERLHGLAMPALIGGYGVAEAALAGLSELGVATSEARAVVQGFGAMGGSAALYLHRAGARVVAIADARGLLVNTDRGLDVPALLAARSDDGIVDRAVLRADDQELANEAWLDIDADVLIPAAVSYVLTRANHHAVRARLIVEAANVPTTPEAEDALSASGVVVIPDFVANTGAAAWAWWVIFGLVDTPGTATARLSAQLRPLVVRLLRTWRDTGAAPRVSARRIAEAELDRMANSYGETEATVPLFQAGSTEAAPRSHSETVPH